MEKQVIEGVTTTTDAVYEMMNLEREGGEGERAKGERAEGDRGYSHIGDPVSVKAVGKVPSLPPSLTVALPTGEYVNVVREEEEECLYDNVNVPGDQ